MASLLERTAVGKPRDIGKQFVLADMKGTPYTTQVKKGGAPRQTLVEWPVDNYPTVAVGGVVDNADADSSAYENMFSGAAVLSSYLQIRERIPSVSRLAEEIEVGGIPARQAVAKSIAKAIVMLKRDIEAICLGDNECQLDNGTVAYQTRGLAKWLQNGAQSVLPVAAAYRTPAAQVITAAIDTIDDETLKAAMKSNWEQSGQENMTLQGFVHGDLKEQFSKLTKYVDNVDGKTVVTQFSQDAKSKALETSIDMINTDFGNVHLHLAPFVNESGDPTSANSKRNGYLVPMNMCELGFLRTPNQRELPRQTGGRRFVVEAVFVHKYLNPLVGIKFDPAAAST
jgi:hypothetical protein